MIKKSCVRHIAPILCVGLLCTPAYATETQETERISVSEEMDMVQRNAVEESMKDQTAVPENEGTDTNQEMESVAESTEDSLEESTSEAQETTEEATINTIAADPAETGINETAPEDSVDETMLETTESTEGETDSDLISVIESESGVDADGFVRMNISAAENVTLPVTVTMKDKSGAFSFTVSYQNQPVKIKPGSYHITKVVDGENKELANGANLVIPEENGEVYLDFTKPAEENNSLFSQFAITNLFFLPIAFLLFLAYKWWLKHN